MRYCSTKCFADYFVVTRYTLVLRFVGHLLHAFIYLLCSQYAGWWHNFLREMSDAHLLIVTLWAIFSPCLKKLWEFTYIVTLNLMVTFCKTIGFWLSAERLSILEKTKNLIDQSSYLSNEACLTNQRVHARSISCIFLQNLQSPHTRLKTEG